MLELRPAAVTDAEEITRIYVESWNAGFGHIVGEKPHSAERVERMRRDLQDPTLLWTVADRAGSMVGFCATGPSRDPFGRATGELDTIAVDPPAWRTGVGRALMEQAVDQLRADYTEAVVWTVAGYERGAAFYTATGWTGTGTTRANGTETSFERLLR